MVSYYRGDEVSMRYAILLQQHPDGQFQASVPAIPGLIRVGATRDDTLQSIQQAIVTALATAEVVYIDIPDTAAASVNPWVASAGMFADDPTLEPMLAEIYAARDAE